MTTPTSEPTRDEQRNALYESRGWEERSNDHVRMDDLADEIIRLRTALANAEREREAANDRAHNADVIIGNVSTILNAHDRLLTVESAARELVSERDALQRTVEGMESKAKAAWMEHAFCGDQAPSGQWFIDVVREKPQAFEYFNADDMQAELDAHLRAFEKMFVEWSQKYDEALTTTAPEVSDA